MAQDVSSWLPNLLGPLNLFLDGVPYLGPRRSNVNLIGMLLSDDPANDATNLIAESSLGLPSQTPDDAQATADVQGAAGFLDSTASNLPSVIDSNGRLRRLAYNLYFNITDPQFGAKVDGSTDDTIAFQAALAAAAAVGGTLQLAWGNMVIAYAGQISVPTNVRILGQHAQTTGGGYESGIGSIITFTGAGGGLLWPDGTFECELEHVLLSTGATAGPAIQIASGVGVGNFHFNHFSIDHGNPNVEAFVAGASTDGCGLEDSTFEHFDIQLPAAATTERR